MHRHPEEINRRIITWGAFGKVLMQERKNESHHITEFGGPEVLKMQEVDTPVISEKQVLIRVMATSANYTDVLSRRGLSLFPINMKGI